MRDARINVLDHAQQKIINQPLAPRRRLPDHCQAHHVVIPLLDSRNFQRLREQHRAGRDRLDNFLQRRFGALTVVAKHIDGNCPDATRRDVDGLDVLIIDPDNFAVEAADFGGAEIEALNHPRQIAKRFKSDVVAHRKPPLSNHQRAGRHIAQQHAERLTGKNDEDGAGTDGGDAAGVICWAENAPRDVGGDRDDDGADSCHSDTEIGFGLTEGDEFLLVGGIVGLIGHFLGDPDNCSGDVAAEEKRQHEYEDEQQHHAEGIFLSEKFVNFV